MLGYLNSEVDDMVNALKEVQLYLPPGKAADTLRKNIFMAQEFIEGLITEGYTDNV